jgi:hypothetical protein
MFARRPIPVKKIFDRGEPLPMGNTEVLTEFPSVGG